MINKARRSTTTQRPNQTADFVPHDPTQTRRWTSTMPESVEATTTAGTGNPNAAANKGGVNGNVPHSSTADGAEMREVDDFGLPVKKRKPAEQNVSPQTEPEETGDVAVNGPPGAVKEPAAVENGDDESGDEQFKDALSTPNPEPQTPREPVQQPTPKIQEATELTQPEARDARPQETVKEVEPVQEKDSKVVPEPIAPELQNLESKEDKGTGPDASSGLGHTRGQSSTGQGISEWSHQQLAPRDDKVPEAEEDEWQEMPAYAPYDIYDDDNKLVAREAELSDDGNDAYEGLGGAGKGYTRVQLDEDAQSATSLDENTQYLFKDVNGGTGAGEMEDEEQRDALSQMQATKDLLTEGQRIAYVGMTRLILSAMLAQAEDMATTKGTKKEIQLSAEAMKMWSQKMMVRLYAHMDISTAEQIMIEQLAEHGVMPADLTPTLMQNARVKNPMADKESTANMSSPRPESMSSFGVSSGPSVASPGLPQSPTTSRIPENEEVAAVPPPYKEHEGEDLPEVRTPSQLPTTKSIDIDLRWTVLCDLFLTLIADSIYDSRSRVLLEKVGDNMQVDWLEICRFEKRVTDALEMQQAAEKENWNEDEHKESRRKLALKKRYMMMGLATVGGGLVIGLSAGLLAPVIGAGLAAGFTTIGVAGTGGFLAGAGGAAIITSGAAASGGIIAVRAANRRTGAVKTFEYRPLHNNKRVNLIVTVSGWMTGKVDDVRLPYSTIDPIMGDIYSVLWEPEMLTSMGDTINILATEALTQGLQQVLGSTILIGLMAALQLPVVLTKLAYLIDNPWTVSLDRANAAGLILADSLIDRNLGTRPITFVGYSLGSRVIFSCLKELSRKGAYGLVQNVYLFGSPIVAKKDEYMKARSVVAGRFVNGYATNDWILGYLFRLTSGGISRIAGLAPVEDIPGLENVNVTEYVPGHMSYRTAMPRLLREVGWIVESDEFTEIEDPDPENHAKRQRELINEIEEARKEFEKSEKEKESKGKFRFFGKKKKAVVEKKEWETYQESKGVSDSDLRTEDGQGNNDGVLFDIDAIRAELASEQMEVKELQSTLPPMKLDLTSPTSPNPRNSLRETKSYDASTMLKTNDFKPSPAASPKMPSSPRMSSGNDIPSIKNLDLTSSRSSPHNRFDEYREEEDEIQMTFGEEPSYDSRPRQAALSATPSFNHLPPSPAYAAKDENPVSRPELKSSQTMPAISLDHNAWADEEDEFGPEKEIQMTFA
ncbi:putative membrane protein [Lachnellula suecica]|uniref:Putative membrane protein n=1 Tax=Lachnellula suecica TaxID=602035 RepID=A0A8T9C4X3_9HELO|nr:putative membrane protein [Lachnellula suecica]